MRWSDIPRSPSSRVLRQFGIAFLVFFGAVAAWQGIARGRVTFALVLGFVALAVGIVGSIRPQMLRWLFVGWMIAAFPIGWAISLLLLAFVYFVVFLPAGLISRLVGRDPLALKRSGKEQATYWIPTRPTVDIRRYFRTY